MSLPGNCPTCYAPIEEDHDAIGRCLCADVIWLDPKTVVRLEEAYDIPVYEPDPQMLNVAMGYYNKTNHKS